MLPGILTASELERAFQRERARVDRNAQCFSIVVFHVVAQSDDDPRRLAAILLERVREYDDVGIVDNRRLATLLPEADGEDAWQFADQALLQISEAGLAVNCEVFTYPHPESGYASGGASTEGERPGDSNGTSIRGPARGPSENDGPSNPRALARTSSPSAPMPVSVSEGPRQRLHPRGASLAEAMLSARVDRSGSPDGSPAANELDPIKATGTDPRPAPLRAVHEPPTKDRPAPVPFDQRPKRAVAPRKIGDLATLFEEPLPLYRRIVDIVVAGLALIALTPVFAVTAVAVKLTSPGSLIFGQWRAGRGGRPFRFYKFRSMYQDAEAQKNELRLVNEKDGPIFKIKDDPRITPVGRIIRKLSIDELPQLVNVLRGDMTLVGPRPPVMDEVEGYEPWQRQRLEVTGGITCIWQVSGRSEVTFKEWMRMDVRYRKKRSLGLDLKLIWKTFGAVFSGKGAY